jgi:hypothetical protein
MMEGSKEMARRIQARDQVAKARPNSLDPDELAKARLNSLDPDELRSMIRDGLLSMGLTAREDFIHGLDVEMRRANFNMRTYLVPLGIVGRSAGDLTPTEVGHLIRYLKMIVPRAMPAVWRLLDRYSIFAGKKADSAQRLAA